MPLIFDVESVGAGNTNASVVARLPLGANTTITAVTAVFANGGPLFLNLVLGEVAESGIVAGNGAVAVTGNQVFSLDAGQTLTTAGVVYTFVPLTSPIYPAGGDLTLRLVSSTAGAGGIKVIVYTTADIALPVSTQDETSFNPLGYQPQIFYPFGMPYQPLAQWLQFTPGSGAYTYTVSPGFTLGSLYFPNLTTPVALYAGTSSASPNLPFYTTGSGGDEIVPLPSGLTSITLYCPSLDGATMLFFVTSSIFDPQKSTPSSAAVTSIGVTAPLTSTGGAAPTLAITTPLAVVYGGTGTATPSLVNGTGISITGTWPNQTITATVVGTYLESLTAVAPLSTSGGINPVLSLNTPLAVTYGGTGVTTPSIVAGSGINVTGTWPNQTISVTSATSSPVYDYNTSSFLAGGYVISGSATTSSGGTVTITTSFPNAVLGAVANSTSSTPYIINVTTISGKSVTFAAFSTSGTATSGVPFSFTITGN